MLFAAKTYAVAAIWKHETAVFGRVSAKNVMLYGVFVVKFGVIRHKNVEIRCRNGEILYRNAEIIASYAEI